jgi:hypothetical protein
MFAHPLTVGTFVAHRVARPFADASRSHWLTAVMMFSTRRPAAELVSSDSSQRVQGNPAALQPFQQFPLILDAAGLRDRSPKTE